MNSRFALFHSSGLFHLVGLQELVHALKGTKDTSKLPEKLVRLKMSATDWMGLHSTLRAVRDTAGILQSSELEQLSPQISVND